MKSIYFLSFNMISFVPYAFGFLKSYARKDSAVAAGYRWHPPLTTLQPVEDAVAAIEYSYPIRNSGTSFISRTN